MQTTVATPPGIDLGPILAALDPEQRAAAILPDGPAQIIAPAGSGKTTTMVAHLAVLLARGVPPSRICVVTFNRDAAQDLAGRVAKRLSPSVPDATSIEVRTLHALARQVLLDAGEGSNILADRLPLLRAARRRHATADPSVSLPEAPQLDTWLSAWKVERRAPPADAEAVLRTYEELLLARGAVDFDDLVVRAADLLATDAALRLRWQSRFEHVCVDEFQDVDAAQLRLVRLLAAPQDNLFVVGDDDQTIYAWSSPTCGASSASGRTTRPRGASCSRRTTDARRRSSTHPRGWSPSIASGSRSRFVHRMASGTRPRRSRR